MSLMANESEPPQLRIVENEGNQFPLYSYILYIHYIYIYIVCIPQTWGSFPARHEATGAFVFLCPQGNLEYPAYVGLIVVAEEGSMTTSAWKCSTQREGTDDLKTPFQMPAFNVPWAS